MNDFGTALAPAAAYLPPATKTVTTCNGQSVCITTPVICFAPTICIEQ